ncbi:E3 ubiquitin-protein ligase DTX3L [Ascaphus truei]|uniref:E3 ubiquitin-protein ligase DTX3L n=1 Tax=Ascaphus truei TaxID=8439 RepID=UPI003F5A3182
MTDAAEISGGSGHPLLVRVSHPEDLTRKLEKYFQSNKMSGGGECQVTRRTEDSTCYTVTFREMLDKARVLYKKDHLLDGKPHELKITILEDPSSCERDENQNKPNVTRDSVIGLSLRAEECSGAGRSHHTHQSPQYLEKDGDSSEAKSREYQENVSPNKSDVTIPSSEKNKEPQPRNTTRDFSPENPPPRNTTRDFSPENPQPRNTTRDFSPENPQPRNTTRDFSPENPQPRNTTRDFSAENPKRTPNCRDGAESLSQRRLTAEIFPSVTAALNTEVFSKKQREGIRTAFPNLRVTKESANGIEEVTGTFQDIAGVNRYLQEQPMESEENGAYSSSDKKSPPQEDKNTMYVSSALYDYFNEIYTHEVDQIKHQCNVDIESFEIAQGSTGINLIPLKENSCIEKAKQLITDTIRRITSDWTQKVVTLPQTIPAKEIKQRVKARFSKTLVRVEGDKVTLQGPEGELSQAKTFLEEGQISSAVPQRAVMISAPGLKVSVAMDARHLDILKKLKSREIKEIEQKYAVTVEEGRAEAANVQVTFRASDGPPDLRVHASRSFLSLLQKTITNIDKKSINVGQGFQEARLALFNEKLKMEDIEIMIEYSKGSLVLIGSPNQVLAAENILNKLFQVKGAEPVRGAEGDTEEPMDTSDSSSPKANRGSEEEEDKCPICLDKPKNKQVLDKCKHVLCAECWQQAKKHKPVCPVCNVSYGVVTGNQPDGRMTDIANQTKLPGYNCGTIRIDYSIPGGTQGANHPHPGKRFSGTTRTAYLPDNTEGRHILRLLRKAFDQRLVFTVGDSRTTGTSDTVTWNDIHHKTSTHGGPSSFGYPDPGYLDRVRDELKAKGIE